MAAPSTPATPISPAPAVATQEPSQIEQDHIEQALSASDTALSAIDTLLNISMWTLGILAIALAVIGIIGWSVIRAACLNAVKQIANERFDSYMGSEEFRQFTQDRVDRAVKANWQNHLMKRIEEAVRKDSDPSPFPTKPTKEEKA
ncbi:hypothetical protein K3181_07880 [Qipengyuania sp. YG27]|uniref:Uncharacterized protein n=1 Tax=Qipengyuania mesophila TaxID=2867246 RepID=A0ABS7JUQ8_9SPHN|nr:hypothetical protein [Qipengyuania mesophila]MBX7501357.1 hypothetical protein [Qipengyuania mesophila]